MDARLQKAPCLFQRICRPELPHPTSGSRTRGSGLWIDVNGGQVVGCWGGAGFDESAAFKIWSQHITRFLLSPPLKDTLFFVFLLLFTHTFTSAAMAGQKTGMKLANRTQDSCPVGKARYSFNDRMTDSAQLSCRYTTRRVCWTWPRVSMTRACACSRRAAPRR